MESRINWEAPNYVKLNEHNILAKILWNFFPARGFLTNILDKLENFAWCERPSKKVGADGWLLFNRRKVYIDAKLAGQRIKIFETLNGLEAEDEMGKLYFLADYKSKICCPPEKLVCGVWIKDENTYRFKRLRTSKRLDTNYQMLRVKMIDDGDL